MGLICFSCERSTSAESGSAFVITRSISLAIVTAV